MKRGGSSEPWATARKEPMPIFSICLRSKTSTLKPCCLPSFLASRPGSSAWRDCAGRLANSRASADAGRDGLALVAGPWPPPRPAPWPQTSDTCASLRRGRCTGLGVAVDVDRIADGDHQGLGMGGRQRLAADTGDGELGHAERLELTDSPAATAALKRLGRTVGRGDERQPRGLHACRPMQVEAAAGLELEVALLDGVVQQGAAAPCRAPSAPSCRRPRRAAHRRPGWRGLLQARVGS